MVDVHKELMKLRAEIPASDTLPKTDSLATRAAKDSIAHPDSLKAGALRKEGTQSPDSIAAAKAVILIRDANARLMNNKLDEKAIEECRVAKGILKGLPEGTLLPYSGMLYAPDGRKYIFGKEDIQGSAGDWRTWAPPGKSLQDLEGIIDRGNAWRVYLGFCADWISNYEQGMAAKVDSISSTPDSLAKINQKLVQEQKVTEPNAISDGLKLMHLVNIAEGEIKRGEYQKAIETIRLADAHLAAGKEAGWGHFKPPEGVETENLPVNGEGWVELRTVEDYAIYTTRLLNFAEGAQRGKAAPQPAAAGPGEWVQKAGISDSVLSSLRGERGVRVDSEEKRALLEEDAAWHALRLLKGAGLISSAYVAANASEEERKLVNAAFTVIFIKGAGTGKKLLEAAFAINGAQDAKSALEALASSIPDELAGGSEASRKWFNRMVAGAIEAA